MGFCGVSFFMYAHAASIMPMMPMIMTSVQKYHLLFGSP